MKTIKLILPDQIYQIALSLAQSEEAELGQFCAGVLGDTIIEISHKLRNKQQFSTPVHLELPDTVAQVQEICRGVWQDQKDFAEALSTTAYKYKVQESTVRDKCTRRINLASISDFLRLLAQPPRLIDHLCGKFPTYAAEIRKLFGSILPGGGSASAPVPIPRTPPPPRDVPEIELISAIISVLKARGGKLDKPQVEREIFDQYKELFQHPAFQEEVGGGVERWRKNVQFARNTACNTLGLIKPPEQSGRGIWELTDKGHLWVR